MNLRISKLLQCVLILTSTSLCFAEGNSSISDNELGLSKTDVKDVPSPEAYTFNPKFPGSNDFLPRAYVNAPPQIPHNIERFTPVTTKNNQCKGCHDRPQMWGTKRKGLPTPIPESHYTDMRNDPGTVTKKLVSARFVCTQCHVPQAATQPLVENGF
jgi:nitrate reductase (cytochrome), electron transfer subunit